MEKQNKSCEPMEIDLSSHSADMDISYSDYIADKTFIKQAKDDSYEKYPTPVETIILPSVMNKPESNIKKFHIQTQSKGTYHVLKLRILSAMLVLFLSIITYHVFIIKCSDEINLNNLKQVLSTKLYGQSEAINSIIMSLNVTDRSKILFFYGGTGVGKTYAASLILESVGYSSNIYHYTMPSFADTFSTDFMIGLSVCKQSMMIVDDLNRNDMHITPHIKDVIEKSESLGNTITVILIYNCNIDDTAKGYAEQCKESYSTKLLDTFKEIRSLKILVKFNSLTEEHLKKCIQNELKHRDVDRLDFNKILKNFNVSVDGCKGVHTKMKILDTA